MKKALLLTILCCLGTIKKTHAQYWCWAFDTSIMSEAGASQGAAADLYGNIYTFGTGRNLLKHKSADGSVVWMRNSTGSAGWYGTKLTTDVSGNLYAFYDSTLRVSRLMKLDSFGNTVWTRDLVGWTPGSIFTLSINPDNIGNLFVSGTLTSPGVACGTDTAFNTMPNQNSFVARFDTLGNLKWIKPVISPHYAWASSVAGDLSGNVFIGGICKGDTLTILDTTVILGIGTGRPGIFVAKCDSNGHLLWITANRHLNGPTYTTAVNHRVYHIRADDAGNAYFAGMLYETDTLGSVPLSGYASGNNAFIAKYRGSDGGVQWAQTGGNAGALYSLSCSRLGKPYLIYSANSFTTHFGTTTFTLTGASSFAPSSVWGFDSSGNVICGFMLGGSSAEDDVGVVTDQQGNAYIHGDYMNTVNFGEIVKTSTTGERYFLAKYTCNCLCGTSLTIGAGSTMCTGATTTMTGSGSGGTWTSSTPSVATVTSAGVITAVSAGTSLISYTTGGGCIGTSVLTVVDGPTVTGGSVCAGTSVALSGTPTGGTWTSGATGVATVGPTGVVTGVAGGTALISYEISAAACIATAVVTVSTTMAGPTPTGINICTGATALVPVITPGGTWSSSDLSVATVGLTTGVASGIAPGTAVISYVSPGGCTETTNVTVNALPGPIAGKLVLCETFSTMLSCTPLGGTWSSTSGATMSSSGMATGITAGTAVITYMLPGGCYSTAILSINPLPAPITGPITVAVGSSITLADATPGGAWTSDDTTKGKVNSIGKVTGIGIGTATIYYTLPTGCKQSVVLSVGKAVSVATVAKTLKPSLYPNPASNEITVKAEQSTFTSFTIYNVAGQVVATYEITDPEIKVNVKAYPPGEYQVVFKGNGTKEVIGFTRL